MSPNACAICQTPFTPTVPEQALAAAALAALPTRCQICRLLRRTVPRPAPPPVAAPAPVVHTLADYPKRPTYRQQPMRLYAEVAAWIAQRGGRLPMCTDFIHDPQLPTPQTVWEHVGTLALFFAALETLGLVPGAHAQYLADHAARQRHNAAVARRAIVRTPPVPRERRDMRRYRRLKAAHQCVTCGAPAASVDGHWYVRCPAHLADIAQRSRRRPSRATAPTPGDPHAT